MPTFFINYRRADQPAFVNRIDDYLRARFGSDNVFIDKQSIPVGAPFDTYIRERVVAADIIVALIGPGWVHAFAEKEAASDIDYVRLELELAIEHGKLIAPLCIGDTPLPTLHHLPASVRPVLSHQVGFIRDDRSYFTTITGIFDEIEAYFTRTQSPPEPHARSRVTLKLDMTTINPEALQQHIAGLLAIGVADIEIVQIGLGSLFVTVELPASASAELVQLVLDDPARLGEFQPQNIYHRYQPPTPFPGEIAHGYRALAEVNAITGSSRYGLRSHLTTMHGFSTMAVDMHNSIDMEKRLHFNSRIQNAVQSMTRMVDALETLGRLTSGYANAIETVVLQDTLGDLADWLLALPNAEQANIDFDLPTEPVRVISAPERLSTALKSFVFVAVEHPERLDALTISLAGTTITLRVVGRRINAHLFTLEHEVLKALAALTGGSTTFEESVSEDRIITLVYTITFLPSAVRA